MMEPDLISSLLRPPKLNWSSQKIISGTKNWSSQLKYFLFQLVVDCISLPFLFVEYGYWVQGGTCLGFKIVYFFFFFFFFGTQHLVVRSGLDLVKNSIALFWWVHFETVLTGLNRKICSHTIQLLCFGQLNFETILTGLNWIPW